MGAMAAALCMAATGEAAMDADLPPEKTQGKVTYLSGGIGLDQQAAMKQAANEYPLELEFLESGEAHAVFAAGVQVTITDRTGKVVRSMVRGKTVFVDGTVVGAPGWGQFVKPNHAN